MENHSTSSVSLRSTPSPQGEGISSPTLYFKIVGAGLCTRPLFIKRLFKNLSLNSLSFKGIGKMLQNEPTEHERHKAPVYSCCVATLTFGRLFLFPNAPYGASGALHPEGVCLIGGPEKPNGFMGKRSNQAKSLSLQNLNT